MDTASHRQDGGSTGGSADGPPPDLHWPSDDTRIPDWIYTDRRVYDLEQERIFLGRHWNFVGLECEIPKPGDYVRSFVGAIPVVLTRDGDGAFHVFENRCAHRGVEFCRDYRGNAERFICPAAGLGGMNLM